MRVRVTSRPQVAAKNSQARELLVCVSGEMESEEFNLFRAKVVDRIPKFLASRARNAADIARPPPHKRSCKIESFARRCVSTGLLRWIN